MSASRPRLGRGLGALLPTMEEYEENAQAAETNQRIALNPSHATLAELELSGERPAAPISASTKPAPSRPAAAKPTAASKPKDGKPSHKSMKRASMPALSDVVSGTDLFFEKETSAAPALAEAAQTRKTGASAAKSKTTKAAASKDTEAEKAAAEARARSTVAGGYLAELNVDVILPNAHQPRSVFDDDDLSELSESIKEVGVLQPIVVRKIAKDSPLAGQGEYELIMGERRLRATRRAGIPTIPAIVKTTSDGDMLRDALLENLHRVALNPLEEAAAYQQMIEEFGLTQQQLSQSVSKSRPQIANTLRLLQLPVAVQKKVAAGVLSAGHARALLSLKDPEAMAKLADRIVAEGLSVRSTEEIVAMAAGKAGKAKKERKPRASAWGDSDIPNRLESHFDTKVAIKGTKKHGRIEITFSSPEDLERIIALMNLAADEQGDGWV